LTRPNEIFLPEGKSLVFLGEIFETQRLLTRPISKKFDSDPSLPHGDLKGVETLWMTSPNHEKESKLNCLFDGN